MINSKVIYSELKNQEIRKIEELIKDETTRDIEKFYLKSYLQSLKHG